MPFAKKSAPVDLTDTTKHTKEEFLDLAESIIWNALQNKKSDKLALDVLKLRGASRGWKSGMDLTEAVDPNIEIEFTEAKAEGLQPKVEVDTDVEGF